MSNITDSEFRLARRRELQRVAAITASLALSGRIATAFASPPIPMVFQPRPSDEFDAKTLDTTVWRTAHPHYRGRPPGIIDSNAVRLADGCAVLTTQSHGDRYLTPWMETVQPIRYGYLEVRARLSLSHINQAFWLYGWYADGTREIDVRQMAPGARNERHRVNTNLHRYDGDPSRENDHNRRSSPAAWEDPAFDPIDWHRYALLWTPETLSWYVDDLRIRSSPNRDFHRPMQVIFTSEIHPSWFGIPSASELPSTFWIDYIRVWGLV